MPRTALLNTLCWIVTKTVAKCRHQRNKHVHALKTCFLLNFLSRVTSIPDVWLFFKTVFKQTLKLEVVILHNYPMESITESLMMVTYKDRKSYCKFMFVCSIGSFNLQWSLFIVSKNNITVTLQINTKISINQFVYNNHVWRTV